MKLFDWEYFICLKAISCHYADSSCEYVECDDVQDLISKEITAIFKKRTGLDDAHFQVKLFDHLSSFDSHTDVCFIRI